MLLPGESSPKTLLFLTILVSSIIAYCESQGGKTLDIKIGFDLTQRNHGGPSLRIRDLKDSTEYNRRAVDDASSSDDSASNRKSSPKKSVESDDRPKKDDSSKEAANPVKSSAESASGEEANSGSDNNKRSTRGLKAADFEPEEDNPKIHGRYQKFSGSDGSNGS